MCKCLITSIFLLGIVLFIAPQEAEASTYYGNGVSCTKKKCSVNWGQSWTEEVQRWGDHLFG
ncbi:leucocin A/sakacin P family class II bacteriocin [Dellaglioa algida]|uniref:leucocin A/sakacin P family class II bacteriocin n=1 Tax=Dellaglioa algida TaxID=105612 RepID=UPI00325F9D62